MKSSNINIRVDKELKEKCEKIYESLGINMSIAINMFLNQTVRVNWIPFEIIAPNIIDEDLEGEKTKIKICNERISCVKIDGMYYFEYNGLKFVIAYETIDADELCIYPGSWKIENRSVIPSVIHFETSNISEYKSKYFDKMLTLSQEIIKIIVLKQVEVLMILKVIICRASFLFW